jgi:AcrR family transcriptional regulator
MNAAVSAPRTARARIRAELTREIKDEARRQIASEGASALSLRGVARELGMVSSALYRYFPSRDELLTALIVDAYDAIGQAAEDADRACPTADELARWLATGHAVRRWASEHPQEYALVYGSPVPGYRAPEATIGPASRVTLVLVGIIADAYTNARPAPVPDSPALSAPLRAEAERLAELVMPGVPSHVVVRAIVAWTQLFGIVSFELFGHLVGVVEELDALFDQALLLTAGLLGLGLVAPAPAPG